MFIYSLHANTLKFFGIVALAVATLITMILLVPTYGVNEVSASGAQTDGVTISYDKGKTDADRISFLKQFGWEVSPEPCENTTVKIPDSFDRIYTGYNELQKAQGLDLSKYRNKSVTRYTYEVTNYPDYDGKVYANLVIYRNRVIAGDICSADPAGFVHGFEAPASEGE